MARNHLQVKVVILLQNHPRKSQADGKHWTSKSLTSLGGSENKPLGSEMETGKDKCPHGHVIDAGRLLAMRNIQMFFRQKSSLSKGNVRRNGGVISTKESNH